MTRDEIVALIVAERERQHAKWGPQDHNYPEWISILTEEIGEAATEANKTHWADTYDEALRHQQKFVTELIQSAAVIFQILENEEATE